MCTEGIDYNPTEEFVLECLRAAHLIPALHTRALLHAHAPLLSQHAPVSFDFACTHSMGNNEDKFFTDWEETFDSFDQMGLHENLLRGIYAYGEQLMLFCNFVGVLVCVSLGSRSPPAAAPTKVEDLDSHSKQEAAGMAALCTITSNCSVWSSPAVLTDRPTYLFSRQHNSMEQQPCTHTHTVVNVDATALVLTHRF